MNITSEHMCRNVWKCESYSQFFAALLCSRLFLGRRDQIMHFMKAPFSKCMPCQWSRNPTAAAVLVMWPARSYWPVRSRLRY